MPVRTTPNTVTLKSMRIISFTFLFIVPFFVFSQPTGSATINEYPSPEKVAGKFRSMLHRAAVDFRPSFTSYSTDSVLIEKGFIYSEETEKVPILIYKPLNSDKKSFPVVICLHGTGGSKEDDNIKKLLYNFSRIGIMGVAIDARFHGERILGGANSSQEYIEAIIKAWRNSDPKKQKHPFLYDTVYDLWRLTDYLITRSDVQTKRIGMMGISMGGIETWMAASVDKRIKVAVPVIAAQSFKWSLENNKWQGRAGTIRKAHEQAAKDLGDSTVAENNVKALWHKLLPGITDQFDCPSMIRLFSPRPLLLLNNEMDVNCPLPGAEIAFKAAMLSYQSKNAGNKFKAHVTPGEPHRFLPEHLEMTIAWFKEWL